MQDRFDTTLILDYKDGKRKRKALSVSAVKQFKEDPYAFYLNRIARVKEPQSLQMMFGSAMHAGMEALAQGGDDRLNAMHAAFDAHFRKEWSNVAAHTERFNQDMPHFADRKQDVEVTLDEMLGRGHAILHLNARLDTTSYTPMKCMCEKGRVEVRVGDLAAERGLPTAQMTLFDPQLGRMVKNMNVAVIGGVPVYGYIDWVLNWSDGETAIIDHKFVTHIVSYYKDGRFFAPSYNPANDLQLDVYCVATGVTRAGFNFYTKHPQYVPSTGSVYTGWVDEQAWSMLEHPGFTLPTATLMNQDEPLHHLMVWRPSPEDHKARIETYLPEQLEARVISQMRKAAQGITESIILLDSGVEPEIAFPAGSPKELSKKSCPFCYFKKQGLCAGRTGKNAATEYMEAHVARDERIAENKEIQELRTEWNNQWKDYLQIY